MPRTRSRLLIALLASVALASAVAAGPALAGATATRTIIYQAFTSAGTPAIHVTSTSRGHCVGGSSATNRSDAWRCFTGNFVYDPCFSSTAAKGIVVCPVGPWTSAGVEIKLGARLTGANKGQPSTSGNPWAVETTSGARCELATGATSILGHLRANYFCQTSKDVLWGYPSRKPEPWTIYSALPTAKKLTKKVAIRVAWF